jgi:hypothetical protein
MPIIASIVIVLFIIKWMTGYYMPFIGSATLWGIIILIIYYVIEERVQVQALSFAKDCYEKKLDLLTNVTVVEYTV